MGRGVTAEIDLSAITHNMNTLSAFAGGAPEENIEGLKVLRRGSKLLFNFSVLPFILRHQKNFDLIIEDLNKLHFFTVLYAKRPRPHLFMHFFGKAIFS